MARDIFMHPTGKEKFRLDQYGQYGDGRSALHLVAELGNVTLWNLAVERPDCDLKVIFDKIDSSFFQSIQNMTTDCHHIKRCFVSVWQFVYSSSHNLLPCLR